MITRRTVREIPLSSLQPGEQLLTVPFARLHAPEKPWNFSAPSLDGKRSPVIQRYTYIFHRDNAPIEVKNDADRASDFAGGNTQWNLLAVLVWTLARAWRN
jgi:hypothetical protein